MQKNCLSILLSVILALSIIGCSSDTTNSNQNISTETTKNEESSSNSEYTDYLKDDIGILFYDSVRNDVTGNWHNAICYTSIIIDEYAYPYYKTYFKDDSEIHFISNLGLKTTSMLSVSGTSLHVTTFEYIDKEEHDAKILGSGTKLNEFYINLENGEFIDATPDKTSGTVSPEELIIAVADAISDKIGAGEKITDIEYNDGILIISVDLSEREVNPNMPITNELLASDRTSSITDAILEMEDPYLNTFNIITVDFGSIGHISCNMNDIVSSEYGRYFEITDDMLVQ